MMLSHRESTIGFPVQKANNNETSTVSCENGKMDQMRAKEPQEFLLPAFDPFCPIIFPT